MLDQALQQPLVGQQQPLIGRIYTQLAEIALDAAQPAVALPAAQSASVIAEATDVPESRSAAQRVLANALDQAKRPQEAFAAHDKAVTLLVETPSHSGGDAERDGSLGVGRTRELFSDAIDFCMRTARIEKALEWLQLSRDATLRRIFDPTKLKAQDKGARETLEKLKQAAAAQKQLHVELAKPTAARNRELGQKLYNWLVAPIAADMAAARQTINVPYGPLYYLPIHALETTGSDGKPVFAIEQARMG